MNYTVNYPLLVTALYEAEFQIVKDYNNRTKAIEVIEKVMKIRDAVEKFEAEAGNTEPTEAYKNDSTGNGSFHQEPSEKQQLQQELNNTKELCERALEFYKSDNEDFSQMFPLLVETAIVPVAHKQVDLAQVINGYIESFLKHTKQMTQYDLQENELLASSVANMADNISLEITEDPNPYVNQGLKKIDEYEMRLNILGLLETNSVEQHIKFAGKDEVSELVNDLLLGKSTIFGN